MLQLGMRMVIRGILQACRKLRKCCLKGALGRQVTAAKLSLFLQTEFEVKFLKQVQTSSSYVQNSKVSDFIDINNHIWMFGLVRKFFFLMMILSRFQLWGFLLIIRLISWFSLIINLVHSLVSQLMLFFNIKIPILPLYLLYFN